ncbi:hypothetical protein IGI52_000589 [Enterococcus sp. DIV0187]
MTLILNEINLLLENYEFWRLRLVGSTLSSEDDNFEESVSYFGNEVENQKYLLAKKRQKNGYDYQTLALDIASLLKESEVPLSTQQIYQKLTDMDYVLSKSNLSHNIMQKINSDSKINVERAYRGFWQYRMK